MESTLLKTRHPVSRAAGFAAATLMALTVIGTVSGCSSESDTQLVASAKTLLAKKDEKGAVIQLKSALQKNPESGEARFLLGKTLLAQGDPVAAQVELLKAREAGVADNQVAPELARALLLMGDTEKLLAQLGSTRLEDPQAAADLQTTVAAAHAVRNQIEPANAAVAEALRLVPGYVPAMLMKARLEAGGGDPDAALKRLDAVLASTPSEARAGVLKGEILLRAKGDRKAALETFRAVIAQHPESVGAHGGALDILFGEVRNDEARSGVAALKSAAPNHPETIYYEAQLAFVDRDYKTVRDLTERLLKVMPENVRVLELAGAAEFRLQQYLQAEALLGKALKNAPQQIVTRQLLAQTHLRAGQPGKTIEVLRPVLESTAADGASLALAGEAYLQMGDNARSEEAFKRALKAAPTDDRVRTSAAMAQLATGNSSAAVNELAAIAAGSSGARADLALISGRLRQNDLPGALKAIDGLEKKLPDSPLAFNLRGRLMLLKKDLPAARKSFEVALSKDPTYFPSVASLAAIEVQEGKPELARKRFEALLKVQPKNYRAMLALAELGARTGASAEETLKLLREATKLDPAAPAPHLLYVNRLLATGDYKAALAAAQDATAAAPSNFDIMDALGRAQVAAGDYQRAISTFKNLTGSQPTNPQHELRLADAYRAAGDNDGATAALKRALRLQPDLALAKRGLALLALADKRPQDALAIARDLQKAGPKEVGSQISGYALEGEIEALRKNWDAAAVAYRAVVQRQRSPDAVLRLHNALLAGGKTAEADRLAADWMKDNPKDAAFHYYLGDIALATGDMAAAELHYRNVLELQPRNALALNNVAWLLIKQGKPGALPLAQQAVSLLPNKAPVLDTLSLALEADNQLEPAVEAQRQATRYEPNDGRLALRLAKLYVKQGDKTRARAELEALAKLGDGFIGHVEVAAMLKTL